MFLDELQLHNQIKKDARNFNPVAALKEGGGGAYAERKISNAQLDHIYGPSYSRPTAPYRYDPVKNPFGERRNSATREKILQAQNEAIRQKFCETHTDRAKDDGKTSTSSVDWDRVLQGTMVVAGGAVVIAAGIGAIVATGGLATPAVAGLLAGSFTTANVMVAGTLTAGVVATGFGISDVIEGAQDLGYGASGDSKTASVNPIRDTVFKNNPELYYFTETVVTYGAGAGSQMINANRPYFETTVGSGSQSEIYYNPLENIKYTDKVSEQMKQGDYHSFPESVEAFGADGKSTQIVGGDGITRTKIEIAGSYKGKNGTFEYIIEPDGKTVNHRLFVPN